MTSTSPGWEELVDGRWRPWWRPAALAGLTSLSWLYEGVVRVNRVPYGQGWIHPHRCSGPVISVGNLTVGGTGKTTTVRWLAERLGSWGVTAAILSHGYHARVRHEKRWIGVVSDGHQRLLDVDESGDEPQLLARSLPGVQVLVGRKRVLTATHAFHSLGADVCIVDDGFQHWRLHRELDLVLINATDPFGGGFLLPRGRLREPVSALRRAHGILVTHADRLTETAQHRLIDHLTQQAPGFPVALTRHRPGGLRRLGDGSRVAPSELAGRPWIALSSLGQPESFEGTLSSLGADDLVPVRFSDHHAYNSADLEQVLAEQSRRNAVGVVTTEKDAVKILSGPTGPFRNWVVASVDLEFLAGQEAIERLLRGALQHRAGHRDVEPRQ